jgi:hypothetical protein
LWQKTHPFRGGSKSHGAVDERPSYHKEKEIRGAMPEKPLTYQNFDDNYDEFINSKDLVSKHK